MTKCSSFQQMHCFRFANATNNAIITNTFYSNNSNIAKIKTAVTNRILKFIPMIEKPIVTNYTFFTVSTFSKINYFI